jgi:hypothetical protein
LGPLATITLKVVPFRMYAPFPALLPFFKCILEIVFCEGVQHCLQFCSAPPAILPRSRQLCQNDGLSILSSIRETEKLLGAKSGK